MELQYSVGNQPGAPLTASLNNMGTFGSRTQLIVDNSIVIGNSYITIGGYVNWTDI